MKKKIFWITETAAMLALLIALQWVTSYVPKPIGQFITGSCVNAVLAITALLIGAGGGIAVAVASPVFAYLFGIAPNLVTVPVIMVGNTLFVTLLRFLYGSCLYKKAVAWIVAAVIKFAVMYALVAGVVCGLAADTLLSHGILKAPMLNMLPATFVWPQLVTALIGGGIALLIAPSLKRALRKD